MLNKRGQDLPTSAIILIVIGIILLVLFVVGSAIGFENLFEKLNVFGGGTSLSSIVQRCTLAASSGDTASYCPTFVKAKLDGKTRYVNCEYSKVRSSMEGKTLTCTDGGLAENKCKELLKDDFKKKYKAEADFNKDFAADCAKIEYFANDIRCDTLCGQISYTGLS